MRYYMTARPKKISHNTTEYMHINSYSSINNHFEDILYFFKEDSISLKNLNKELIVIHNKNIDSKHRFERKFAEDAKKTFDNLRKTDLKDDELIYFY